MAGSPPRAAPFSRRRPTANEELCAKFRDLLTTGFYTINEDGEIEPDEQQKSLGATKPWRNEVWRAFKELEDRLCPVAKFERNGLP